jgi:predicted small integral membrane protein
VCKLLGLNTKEEELYCGALKELVLRARGGEWFDLVAPKQWLCTQNALGMMTYNCYHVCLYISEYITDYFLYKNMFYK